MAVPRVRVTEEAGEKGREGKRDEAGIRRVGGRGKCDGGLLLLGTSQ